MEVPITKFRQEIFHLANRALEGDEIWIRHKGRRLKLVSEEKPGGRLSRLTPMRIVHPASLDLNDPALKAEMMAEMERAWERDWERL
jgi:hypothetical protein